MQGATKVTTRVAAGASGRTVAVLSFDGDISSSSRAAILDAWHALEEAVNQVLLDFSGVDYINSSGIAILIQLLVEAEKSGSRTIGISGLSPHFQKVFTMVGISRYATLYQDESASLAAL